MATDATWRADGMDARLKRLRFLVSMSSLQRSALIGLLVEYKIQPDAPQIWEDVEHGEITTVDDLLDLLSGADMRLLSTAEA